jgi:hypothetical protein
MIGKRGRGKIPIRRTINAYALAIVLGSSCAPLNPRPVHNPGLSAAVVGDKDRTADKLLILGLAVVVVGIILLLPMLTDPNY